MHHLRARLRRHSAAAWFQLRARLRRRSAAAWFEQHANAFAAHDADEIDVETWWNLRVEACWGLIARAADSVPFALEMLRSRNPDVREDGGGVLAEIGVDNAVVDALLEALEAEDEDQPRDSMIAALGRIKNRRAIPFLAETIRAPETDGDTRSAAVEALGKIARQRFDRHEDTVASARSWLEENGF